MSGTEAGLSASSSAGNPIALSDGQPIAGNQKTLVISRTRQSRSLRTVPSAKAIVESVVSPGSTPVPRSTPQRRGRSRSPGRKESLAVRAQQAPTVPVLAPRTIFPMGIVETAVRDRLAAAQESIVIDASGAMSQEWRLQAEASASRSDLLQAELGAMTEMIKHRERWWLESVRGLQVEVGIEANRMQALSRAAQSDLAGRLKGVEMMQQQTAGQIQKAKEEMNQRESLVTNLEAYAHQLQSDGRVVQITAEARILQLQADLEQAQRELTSLRATGDRRLSELQQRLDDKFNRYRTLAGDNVDQMRAETVREMQKLKDEVADAQAVATHLDDKYGNEILQLRASYERREMTLRDEVAEATRRSLVDLDEGTSSPSTLRALLEDAQAGWRKATEEARQTKDDARRQEKRLEDEVRQFKDNTQRMEAQMGRDRDELAQKKEEVGKLRSELRDWSQQYEWQFSTAGSNEDRRAEPKDPASHRRIPEEDDGALSSSASVSRCRDVQGSPSHEVIEPQAREAEKVKVETWP